MEHPRLLIQGGTWSFDGHPHHEDVPAGENFAPYNVGHFSKDFPVKSKQG